MSQRKKWGLVEGYPAQVSEIKMKTQSWEWWCVSTIPALRRQRQQIRRSKASQISEFKASLGYRRPCLKAT